MRDCTPIDIKSDEYECRMQSQQRLAADGIRFRYMIERDRKHNSAGDGHEIRRLYQKYHGDEHFRTDSTILEILIFLYNRCGYEALGLILLQQRHAPAETNPGGHDRIVNFLGSRLFQTATCPELEPP